MTIITGQSAPDFTLYSSEKKAISLASFRGQPVVVLFFPLAFTSVCTAELCAVRDNITWYNQLNVQVLAISVDSPQTLAKFKEFQHLNFTLLSDFNKEVSALYGCLYETFSVGLKGVSKRSAFVIDAEGLVQYAEVLENAGEQPDFKAIESALEKLRT